MCVWGGEGGGRAGGLGRCQVAGGQGALACGCDGAQDGQNCKAGEGVHMLVLGVVHTGVLGPGVFLLVSRVG